MKRKIKKQTNKKVVESSTAEPGASIVCVCVCIWCSAAGVAAGYLMGSADEVQVVAVEELADHVGSEREGDAAVVLSPALHVFVRVRPQQVAQEACRGRNDGGVNWWEDIRHCYTSKVPILCGSASVWHLFTFVTQYDTCWIVSITAGNRIQ